MAKRGFSALNQLKLWNTSTSTDALTIVTTSDDAASGPLISLIRNSSSPAASDVLGKIQFKGKNDNGDTIRYASIDATIRGAADGNDKSKLTLTIRKDGQHKGMLVVQNDGVLLHLDTPLVFQSSGWKKTFVSSIGATAKRIVKFPDQSGTVMLNESGKVMAPDLPTSDPGVANQLWNDSGTVKVSAG
jgi:hypothetical protein